MKINKIILSFFVITYSVISLSSSGFALRPMAIKLECETPKRSRSGLLTVLVDRVRNIGRKPDERVIIAPYYCRIGGNGKEIFSYADVEKIVEVLSIARGFDSSRAYSWDADLFELLTLRLGLKRAVLEVGLHGNSAPRIGMLRCGVRQFTSIDYYDNWPKEYKWDAQGFREFILSGNDDYQGPKIQYVPDPFNIGKSISDKADYTITVRARHLSVFKLRLGIKDVVEKPVQAVVFNHSLGFIGTEDKKNDFSKKAAKKIKKALAKAKSVLEQEGYIIVISGSYPLHGERSAYHSKGVIVPILQKFGFNDIFIFTGNTDEYFDKFIPPNTLIIARRSPVYRKQKPASMRPVLYITPQSVALLDRITLRIGQAA